MLRKKQRRIYTPATQCPARTVTEHNRADGLEQAWQAVMAGTLTYTEFCLISLDLYPLSEFDQQR